MHTRTGDPRGRSTAARPASDLASVFGDLALALHHPDDPETTLQAIVEAAVRLIPGCDDGSIIVVTGRRKVTSTVASGDLPKRLDALQEEYREGPCLDAVFDHATVCVPDLAADPRWPAFSRRAVEAGAGGMLAFQLHVAGDNLGALNLLSHRAGAFDEESQHVGELFATHASVAFAAARRQAATTRTVATRHLIGQAEGILMERHKISADQAFALLVQASQRSNTKLREVAGWLVHSGQLEPRP